MEQISSITVTREQVLANMEDVFCTTLTPFDMPVTFVEVRMKNGFTVRESTTCVDPANYNEEIGKQICLKRIEDKIWLLLGYKLQDDIYNTAETIKDIDIYQDISQLTNKYQEGFEKTVCCSLGLASEAGEVAGKVDKSIRKTHSTDFTDEQKRDIALEIGDCFWFAAGLAKQLEYKLSDILKMNRDKLADREKRNKICGSGDHR